MHTDSDFTDENIFPPDLLLDSPCPFSREQKSCMEVENDEFDLKTHDIPKEYQPKSPGVGSNLDSPSYERFFVTQSRMEVEDELGLTTPEILKESQIRCHETDSEHNCIFHEDVPTTQSQTSEEDDSWSELYSIYPCVPILELVKKYVEVDYLKKRISTDETIRAYFVQSLVEWFDAELRHEFRAARTLDDIFDILSSFDLFLQNLIQILPTLKSDTLEAFPSHLYSNYPFHKLYLNEIYNMLPQHLLITNTSQKGQFNLLQFKTFCETFLKNRGIKLVKRSTYCFNRVLYFLDATLKGVWRRTLSEIKNCQSNNMSDIRDKFSEFENYLNIKWKSQFTYESDNFFDNEKLLYKDICKDLATTHLSIGAIIIPDLSINYNYPENYILVPLFKLVRMEEKNYDFLQNIVQYKSISPLAAFCQALSGVTQEDLFGVLESIYPIISKVLLPELEHTFGKNAMNSLEGSLGEIVREYFQRSSSENNAYLSFTGRTRIGQYLQRKPESSYILYLLKQRSLNLQDIVSTIEDPSESLIWETMRLECVWESSSNNSIESKFEIHSLSLCNKDSWLNFIADLDVFFGNSKYSALLNQIRESRKSQEMYKMTVAWDLENTLSKILKLQNQTDRLSQQKPLPVKDGKKQQKAILRDENNSNVMCRSIQKQPKREYRKRSSRWNERKTKCIPRKTNNRTGVQPEEGNNCMTDY